MDLKGLILRNAIPTLAGLVLIYTPFLWCRYRHENPLDYGLSWKMEKRPLVECLIVIAVVLIPLTVVSMNWPFEQLPRHSGWKRTLDIGAAGIAAAIIEEIFFRGWMLPLFRRRFGAFLSISFTSAIFALSHIFVAQSPFLVAVFFPGFIMGVLRERHGNIATSTLFHAVCNVWAIWFAPLRWPSFQWIGAELQKLIS